MRYTREQIKAVVVFEREFPEKYYRDERNKLFGTISGKIA